MDCHKILYCRTLRKILRACLSSLR